jgi:hypothetical protein
MEDMMRRFSVQLNDDLYAPDYPEGSYIVMDPALPPEDGKFVYVRLHFSGKSHEMLTVYQDFDGRDENGRFCKRGSPEEVFSFCPVKFRRDERHKVTILGVEVGQLVGDAELAS